MALPAGRCPECGFDPPTVSPADAAVAARSFPRRYRALLVRPDDDDPEIVHRRAGGEPSAAEQAARGASGMAAAAEALGAIRISDGPTVDVDGPPGAPAGDSTPLDAILERLAAAAGGLADSIEPLRGDEWNRTGVLPGGADVPALDVARHGVHAGVHHLRAAERAVAQARAG